MPPNRFRPQFFANQTAEWQDQYLDYDRLVGLLRDEHASLPRKRATSRLSFYSEPDSAEDVPMLPGMFAHELQVELDKVSAFAGREFAAGKEHLQSLADYAIRPAHDHALLRKAMVEVCRLFMLLSNYCAINLAAAHDLAEARGRSHYKVFLERLRGQPPAVSTLLEGGLPEQINLLTGMHAKLFFRGSVSQAQEDLERRQQRRPMRYWDVFTLGLYVGLCIPLALLVFWIVFANPFITEAFDWDRLLIVAPVLRGFLLLNAMTWLWAGAVMLMNRSRVNHNFVLELDPSTALTEHHICRLAAFDLFLWMAFVLLYAGKAQGQLSITPHPPEFWIKAYVWVWVLLRILPVPFTLPWPTKWWIVRQITSVVIAPAVPVTFASNFVGDFLTSSVKVLVDLWYTVCFLWYVNVETLEGQEYCLLRLSPFLLTGLPLWWRMLQCARRYFDTGDSSHWINFGKYLVALMAVVAGFVWPHYRQYSVEWNFGHIAQFTLLTASTVYGFMWDIFKDWALFVKRPDGTWGYRRMVMRYEHAIHFCTLINLIGRCAWMYTIMVAPPGTRWRSEILNFVTAFVEIYRRTQWTLLRIGNEHWGNVSRFRAVAVAPLVFSQGARPTVGDGQGEGHCVDQIEEFLRDVHPLVERAKTSNAFNANLTPLAYSPRSKDDLVP